MDPLVFPETFDGLDDSALAELATAARAEGAELLAASTFSTEGADRLDVLDAGLTRIEAELAVRAEADAALAARHATAAARFAATPAVEAPVVEAPAVETLAVEPPLVATTAVTPARPGARTIVANAPATVIPAEGNAGRGIIASAGIEGHSAGSTVTFRDLVPTMMQRFGAYAGSSYAKDPLFQMTFGGIDPALVATRHNLQDVMNRAVDESRLSNPETGEQGLIAAGGWCAPTPQDYDICILAGLDGLLDLPVIGMPRGSLSYFRHLPFSTVQTLLSAGIDCYTQTELEALPALVKPCVEIDCPTPVVAELDACSLCIRAGLIQMKGFPEYVAAWMDLAMIAWARFINARKIAELVAAITADSGAPILIPATFGSIQALLGAIRLAAVDLRAFHSMTQDRTLEVVLPYWIHDVLAVDKSRRQFNGEDDYTEAEFRADLADLDVRVQFVKDWVGQDGGFGGVTPATGWPGSVNFLIYPAGAYIEAREDIITVSTLQDTALLTTNRVQLLFVEYASKVIAACGSGRQYVVEICPSGATAGPIASTPGTVTCPDVDALLLVPSTGLLAAGGQVVTLTGTNLQGTTAITFGGTPGTNVQVLSANAVRVTTPAKAAGAYAVQVTSPLGTDSIAGGATYV